MKKALLITGAPLTGKSMLAKKISEGHKAARGVTLDYIRRCIPPGTEFVIVDEITTHQQIEPYLEFIGVQTIISRVGQEDYAVSPFFILLSNRLQELPEHIGKHVAHLHLTSPAQTLHHFNYHHENLPCDLVEIISSELA